VTLLAAILAATLMAANPVVQERYESGETLDYNLTWLKITGGGARMTIAPVRGEDGAFRITSVAKSSRGFSRIFKVRDEIETIVSRSDFSTLRYTKRLDEQDDKITEVTTIENGVATRTRKKVKKVDVPRPIYDPISVIYVLRMVELVEGKTHEMQLIADGKLYTVRAKVVKRETLQTPAGSFKTVLVEPEMESGGKKREERLFIWYSDDDRRIPVKIRSDIKVGSITATLKSIRNGAAAAEPQVD
jgi:Protein of unknown function (DUF3108)